MAIQIPILSAILVALRLWIRPVISGLWWLLRRKLWFFVTLILIFLGPLSFVGDGVLYAVTNFIPALHSFSTAAQSVNLTGWQSALASIGEGASLANCVIDLNTYIRIAAIMWIVMCAQISFVCVRFLYTILPGKAT